MGGTYTDHRKSEISWNFLWKPWNIPAQVEPSSDVMLDTVTSYRSGFVRDPSQDNFIRTTQNGYEMMNSDWDKGHPFQSDKQITIRSHSDVYLRADDGQSWYRGPLVIHSTLPGGTFPYPTIPSWDPNYYGSVALSNTMPTNPEAGMSQFIGEMQQIPHVIGTRLLQYQRRNDYFRSLGEEYLNVAFGWIPFMKDITKLILSVQRMNKTIAQFIKDNGRIIRRKYDFPEIYTQTEPENLGTSWLEKLLVNTASGINGMYYLFSNESDSRGTLTRTRTSYQKIWFKGAYSYFLPLDDSIESNILRTEALCNKIMGTRITPSTLYELAPWSWLVDWFVSLGSFMKVQSTIGRDGLVLRYGYIMRTTRVTDTYALSGIRFKSFSPGTVTVRLTTVRKERVRATPYGFGVNPNSFSDNQWAILIALGLTKGPKTLKDT